MIFVLWEIFEMCESVETAAFFLGFCFEVCFKHPNFFSCPTLLSLHSRGGTIDFAAPSDS
jgi:hypothetical protein